MKLVIIGAGYAGLTTALRLARARVPARIIVVNDGPEHQLMTQLHKVAAGTVPPNVVSLSLERLLHDTGVELVIGRVVAIEPEHNRVILHGGDPLTYERLVVALGSRTETFGVPGVFEHTMHIQPLEAALRLRQTIGDRLKQAAGPLAGEQFAPSHDQAAVQRDQTPVRRNRTTMRRDSTPVRFAIVGGGLTGVEFAGELADALPDLSREAGIDAARVKITLLEAGPRLLPGLAPFLGAESDAVLRRKGVDVRTGTKIAAVTPEGIMIEDEMIESEIGPRLFSTDAVIWTAGVRGHELTEAAFRAGPRGRALVDEYLRAVDYPNVYIVGDNARAVSKGATDAVAPTAQNAVQQAAVVADNIAEEARALLGEALRETDKPDPDTRIEAPAAARASNGTDAQTGIQSGDEINAQPNADDDIKADDQASVQADARAGDEIEATLTPYVAKPLGLFVSVGQGEAVGELAFGDFWRPRLSGMPAYALKWASEQRYKLGIGAGIRPANIA